MATKKLYPYPHPLFKQQMDELVEQYNKPVFALADPVQFPRRYSKKQDIEIVAFLIATIAWGRREMILNSSEKLLRYMGNSPYDFVMNADFGTTEPQMPIHRTFFGKDLIYFCRGLRSVYSRHDSMESLFAGHDTWQGISNLRQAMAETNGSPSKHVADPNKSACKRLHLALRWLVRDDGIVDIGIWKNVKPSQLFIPLDVHVADTARLLNLTDRRGNDRRTVEQITARLREMDPNDPVKYDFALFGAGIYNIGNKNLDN